MNNFEVGKRYVVALKVNEESPTFPYKYQTFDGEVLQIRGEFIQFRVEQNKEQEVYEDASGKVIEFSKAKFEDVIWHFSANIFDYQEINEGIMGLRSKASYSKPKNGSVGFGLPAQI